MCRTLPALLDAGYWEQLLPAPTLSPSSLVASTLSAPIAPFITLALMLSCRQCLMYDEMLIN